jgi:hypothetical protein
MSETIESERVATKTVSRIRGSVGKSADPPEPGSTHWCVMRRFYGVVLPDRTAQRHFAALVVDQEIASALPNSVDQDQVRFSKSESVAGTY